MFHYNWGFAIGTRPVGSLLHTISSACFYFQSVGEGGGGVKVERPKINCVPPPLPHTIKHYRSALRPPFSPCHQRTAFLQLVPAKNRLWKNLQCSIAKWKALYLEQAFRVTLIMHHCKKKSCGFPVPPVRVWLVTGKPVTFFYSVGSVLVHKWVCYQKGVENEKYFHLPISERQIVKVLYDNLM